jgi:hypothetical protein
MPILRALLLAGLAASAPMAVASEPAVSAGDVAVIKKALAGKALSVEQLVPRGFEKAGEAKGDLDGDLIDDQVLIIHKAPGKEPYEGPQFVTIFLGDRSGRYALWKLGATHFMESDSTLMEKDGVAFIQINKGVLAFASTTAVSVGSWSDGGCTQKWRNGPAGFQLIGLTVDELDRRCACGSETDTNLLTGLEIHKTDRDGEGQQMKKERVTRTKRKPKTILWEAFDYDTMCARR